MADSLGEAAMNGCSVPSSAGWACAVMPPRCEEWKNIFEELKDSPLVNEEPKEMGSLRIATLNVLTLSPAAEREANVLRIPARQARLASTFEDAASRSLVCKNVACLRSWW